MPYTPGDSLRQRALRLVLNRSARFRAWKNKTRRNIYYLETSGLNALADLIEDYAFFDFVKHSLKVEFYLSAIGVWEILLNSNSSRKEKLIYWSQFNTSPYLLASPTEIFVNYIRRGAPRKDRFEFWKNRDTSLEIGKVWKRIHRRIDRTIPVDLDQLVERSLGIRQLSKQLRQIVESTLDEGRTGYEEDFFLRCVNLLDTEFPGLQLVNNKNKTLTLLTTVFTFFFVCIGMELDNSPVRKFWRRKKLTDPCDRLEYLLAECPESFIRGPLLESAVMAEVQIHGSNSKSRGLVHDSLHSVYCYYADHVIAADKHFKDLSDSNDHDAFSRIIPAAKFRTMWVGLEEEWNSRTTSGAN